MTHAINIEKQMHKKYSIQKLWGFFASFLSLRSSRPSYPPNSTPILSLENRQKKEKEKTQETQTHSHTTHTKTKPTKTQTQKLQYASSKTIMSR